MRDPFEIVADELPSGKMAMPGTWPPPDRRYRLSRRWSDGPMLVYVMMNPSTADDNTDDPTIRKCVGFAKRWAYGAIGVVNLFTLRATDPRDLVKAHRGGVDVVGPWRDLWLITAARHDVCVAWGAHPLCVAEGSRVLACGGLPRRLLCIGRTKNGAPRHPLMAAYTDAPEVFRG
jgi:hypothetical protein